MEQPAFACIFKEPTDLHNKLTKDFSCRLTKEVLTALKCLTRRLNFCTLNRTHKTCLDSSTLAKVVRLTAVPWGIRGFTRNMPPAPLKLFY